MSEATMRGKAVAQSERHGKQRGLVARRRNYAAGLVLAASTVAGAVGAVGVIVADREGIGAFGPQRSRSLAKQEIKADDVALALVRTTLASLNDANRTGNYEILRTLAAPEFAARNPAEALARTFDGFRRAGIDLAAVTVMQPMLDGAPSRDRDGRLVIAGRFPGRPLSVVFHLVFADVGGRWRMHGVSVKAEPAAVDRLVGQPRGGRQS